jgi:hypothetical protein
VIHGARLRRLLLVPDVGNDHHTVVPDLRRAGHER